MLKQAVDAKLRISIRPTDNNWMLFRYVIKNAWDGQTDRQTDPQDRASIAASRGKNHATLV